MVLFRQIAALWLCILFSCMVASGQVSYDSGVVKRNGISYVPMSNLRTFYKITSETRSGKSYVYEMPKRQIRMRPGSQDLYMNGVKFVLSYPVVQDPQKGVMVSKVDRDKVIDPVLRPAYGRKGARKVTTVVIDPGHGGHDSGATNRVSREKDLTLSVGLLLRDKLKKEGFRVVMTRETDRYLTLKKRVEIANRQPDAVFISIHFNDGSPSSNGIETFTLAPQGTSSTMSRNIRRDSLAGNAQDSLNIALATTIQGQILRGKLAKARGYRLFDRGIKRARFSVLCTIRHPAVLVECGFLSNAREAGLARSRSYQEFLATAICNAVMQYKSAIKG